VSHAVTAGRREVKVAFNVISEGTVANIQASYSEGPGFNAASEGRLA
jgi:hypothetical protein